MNSLHKAYQILGLEPGSSKEVIQRRWKRLAMVWHPDRFPSEAGKLDAEEELKKINQAKDLLWDHLESSDHRETGCECQHSTGQSGQQGSTEQRHGPGPGRARTGPEAEEEARRRNEERKKRAAGGESSNTQTKSEPPPQGEPQSLSPPPKWNDPRLRWKIAQAEAVVFVCLCLFGVVGSSIASAIHDWKFEQDRKANQDAADKARREDPCQAGVFSTIPDFAKANAKESAVATAKTWRANCKGFEQGAIVTGEDATGRLITGMYYGPKLTYQGQWLVAYGSTPDSVTVEYWKAPDTLTGRTIYTYDNNHNLTGIQRLDPQLQPMVTATVERRPGGGFYDVVLEFFDGKTFARKLYTPDDPQLAELFQLTDVFGKIPKQIDTAAAISSPTTLPASGAVIPHYTYRPSPYGEPFSTPGALKPIDTTTATDTGQNIGDGSQTHLSPSPFGTNSPSATPGTDALLDKLERSKPK